MYFRFKEPRLARHCRLQCSRVRRCRTVERKTEPGKRQRARAHGPQGYWSDVNTRGDRCIRHSAGGGLFAPLFIKYIFVLRRQFGGTGRCLVSVRPGANERKTQKSLSSNAARTRRHRFRPNFTSQNTAVRTVGPETLFAGRGCRPHSCLLEIVFANGRFAS